MSPTPARRARLSIQIDEDALAQLGKLPRNLRVRIDAKIRALADDPHPPGSRRLSGQDGLYRLRIGDYRVVYAILDQRLLVIVLRVASRSQVYRRLPKPPA